MLDVSFTLAGYILLSCVNVLSDQYFPPDFSEPLSCGVSTEHSGHTSRVMEPSTASWASVVYL